MSEVAETTDTRNSTREVEPGEEALRQGLKDARRVLDHELESLNDVTRKGWRIVQFNALVLTLIVTIVPPQTSMDQLTIIPGFLLLIAGVLIAWSTYTGFKTQTREKVKTGAETRMWELLRDHDYTSNQYFERSLEIYQECIEDVQPRTSRTSDAVQNAFITSIAGIVFLLVGVVVLVV